MSQIKYKRILLKLSGEALAGEKKVGLDFDVIKPIAASIARCVQEGCEIGIVSSLRFQDLSTGTDLR